jgi:sporulation protein YlmC with PRC-barrel domain
MNRTSILGAAAALILVAVPAVAQTRQVEPTATSNRPIRLEAPSGSPGAGPGPSKVLGAFDGMRAGDLIGKSIYNTGGESLGGIEAIVVRREDNEVAALVGMGAFLGGDEKQVAVLLNDLDIQGGSIVVRNLTRTDFQQRRAYQTNGWARLDPDRLIGSTMVR